MKAITSSRRVAIDSNAVQGNRSRPNLRNAAAVCSCSVPADRIAGDSSLARADIGNSTTVRRRVGLTCACSANRRVVECCDRRRTGRPRPHRTESSAVVCRVVPDHRAAAYCQDGSGGCGAAAVHYSGAIPRSVVIYRAIRKRRRIEVSKPDTAACCTGAGVRVIVRHGYAG